MFKKKTASPKLDKKPMPGIGPSPKLQEIFAKKGKK